MKTEHGFDLPRRLQIEFSKTIQHITEDSGTEISPGRDVGRVPLRVPARRAALRLAATSCTRDTGRGARRSRAARGRRRAPHDHRRGQRPDRGVRRALRDAFGAEFDVVDYAEHAIGQGAEATAAAYVETRRRRTATIRWGIGIDPNITTASLRAVLVGLRAPAPLSGRTTADVSRRRHVDGHRVAPLRASCAAGAGPGADLSRLRWSGLLPRASPPGDDRRRPGGMAAVRAAPCAPSTGRRRTVPSVRTSAVEPSQCCPSTTRQSNRRVDRAGRTARARLAHPIKVKVTSGIFHVPGGRFYDRTPPSGCYADAEPRRGRRLPCGQVLRATRSPQ